MSTEEDYREFVNNNIKHIGEDQNFIDLSHLWLESAINHKYALNFSWLGRPIIQKPQDIYAMQELIWKVKPDLIIETGIAHGGSLIMSASMLALIDYCEGVINGEVLDPKLSSRLVIGIDIDIRSHNRKAIESHPMAHKIKMIEGSSTDPEVVQYVKNAAKIYNKVLIFLDSNHTHDHVLSELISYAPLTSLNSYCVVWDTGIEDLPKEFCQDRDWGKGNNPKTAVWEYLDILKKEEQLGSDGSKLKFKTDKDIEHKITITASPDGFLLRV